MAKTLNPAPLGLMGFGMTTVLLNLVNAGLIGKDALGMILPMGIFYGGLAQVIAGLLEAKQGNTFGATAFTSYGLFWLSFVALHFLPALGLSQAPSATSLAAYLIMWGIFTGFMSIATLKSNTALQVVFVSLTILFFILAVGDLTGAPLIKTLGGYEGIFCGFSAIYLAMAEILNESYNRTVLPIGQKQAEK
ncbi:MAG: acetate uptake transporter [Candidatus Bathyarchaeota archaeon]|nr:acetate uptake transporter [Candidatus Bathyarchaeota archaeon]